MFYKSKSILFLLRLLGKQKFHLIKYDYLYPILIFLFLSYSCQTLKYSRKTATAKAPVINTSEFFITLSYFWLSLALISDYRTNAS